MVCKYSAIERIGSLAQQISEGPVVIGGVGTSQTISKHGTYQIRLPLCNGRNAVMVGICLDQITKKFPLYPLSGRISEDINSTYAAGGGNIEDLPRLPAKVGGEVDFMIGSKYMRYHPKLIYSLPSGLSIYESPFYSSDGSRGVIGGPHPVITAIDKKFKSNSLFVNTYMSSVQSV